MIFLTVLHDNLLTHTDLKPENILFLHSDFESIYSPKKVNITTLNITDISDNFLYMNAYIIR